MKVMPIQEYEKYYPCPSGVPFDLLCETQAKKNHSGQGLERLRERMGLSPLECWAIMEQLDWHCIKNVSDKDAGRLIAKRMLLLIDTNKQE
jgi:hypothetical protein